MFLSLKWFKTFKKLKLSIVGVDQLQTPGVC